MSESIWKKEITLRRKPRGDAPAPPKESIWKKEISFRRKRSEPTLVAVEPSAAQILEPWVGRPELPPESLAPEPRAVAAPAPVPSASVPVATFPAVQPRPSQSWPVPQRPEPEPARVEEPQVASVPEEVLPRDPEDLASTWTPAISLEQPSEEAPEPSAPAPQPVATFPVAQPEPEPTVDLVPPPSQSWPVPQRPEPEPAIVEEPQVAANEEAPEPSAPAPQPLAAFPVAQLEPEPEPTVDPQPPASVPIATYPAPPREPQPTVDLLPQPSQSWPAPHRSEPEPTMLDEPLEASAAEEQTPPRELEQSTSIWKKEISLRRAPKTPKPAARPTAKRGSHKAKTIVGLKIGASQLAAARVANNGAAQLLFAAREPLNHGIVVNGELRDPDALVEALKSFFARNKLPRKNVRLGIASNRIGVRIIDVAGIDDRKQLDNAIRFRAQEALPLPLDEAVLDYHVVGESVDDNGRPTYRVVLVVAYRELVERYVSACRRAGISLVGVDLEAFALLRALSAPLAVETEADAALVAVSIGHDRSTLAVSDGRVCEFTRVLEWGGAMLDGAVARALELTPADAEVVKRGLSLEPGGQHPAAVDALRKQVQGFARELLSALQFYQHQPRSLAIGEVVITGGTAMLPGLDEELQRLLGVRVRVGDPLARMKVGKKVRVDDQAGSLAVAIGLGIED
jgi:type IV pilus assembly protein PilM